MAYGGRCKGMRLVVAFQIKFKKDLGYVRCGPTLVALNLMAIYKNEDYPEGPYAECVKEQFSEMKDQDTEKPHVWALTQHCFSQAFAPLTATHTQENQSMIITGESGVSNPQCRPGCC